MNAFGHNCSNSLLVIGNGFDRSLKAKTSYEDFYKLLVKCYNATSFNVFIDNLDQNYKNGDLKLFYDLLQKEAKTNFFINYFILYNKSFNCWVDFESELEKIITGFDYLLTVLKDTDKFVFNGHGIFININKNIDLLSVVTNYPNNNFFSSGITSKDYYSFSINGAKIIDYKTLYKEMSKFVNSFPKSLYKDLSVFSQLFNIYLSIIKDDVSYDCLHSFFKECNVAVNYNYTDFLMHYSKRNDHELKRILYINGECDYFNHKDRIVFGIDSSVPIKNNEFFIFTKTAQRTIKNTDINNISKMLSDFYFNKIIVFGHSLSIADKDTLNYILTNCQRIDGERVNLEVYCYDEESKLSIISNLKVILGLELYTELQINNKLVLKDVEP